MSKVKLLSSAAQIWGKVGHQLSKNAPIIFTTAGVVGIGATSVLAYKSKSKVEDIVDKIESDNAIKRELAELESQLTLDSSPEQFAELKARKEELEMVQPYTKSKIAIDVTAAVAAPVIVGMLSVCAIVLSYQIQNNRIGSLAAALTTSVTENAVIRKKYKAKHGEEEYNQFASTVQEEITYLEKGKEKKKVVNTRDMTDSLTEHWYRDSDLYVSDDMDYNDAMIQECLQTIDNTLFHRGVITLNQALTALGLPTSKAGAIVGWTDETFHVDTRKIRAYSQELQEEVLETIIVFSQPVFVYGNKDVNTVVK